MKVNPLCSILIANYNNGEYLQACLESVFVQTYKNLEIIIVDDCSTDDLSQSIYNKYADDIRIHIFLNEENRGVGFTKRKCLANANGEICGFLDPDDVLHFKACEILVKTHLKYPNHSLIYSTNYICDPNLKVVEINPNVGEIPDCESQLTYHGPRISHFVTFKKKFYDKTNGINPDLRTSEDQDLYFKLEEVGPIKFVNKPLYFYRHHPRSISLNDNKTKASLTNVVATYDAYKRRKKKDYPLNNISFKEMSKRLYRYHIWHAGQYINKRDFKKFTREWLIALKYFYWDKDFYIPRTLARAIREGLKIN